MSNEQSFKSNVIIHPGEILLEELEFLNISQKELSERAGISKKHINKIIKGRESITPLTALKLERVLGVSANFWNNLEKNYKLDLARIEEEEKIKSEIKIFNETQIKETYKDLVKNNYVKSFVIKESNFKNIIIELQNFFGVYSLKYINDSNLKVAFRKYKRNNINQYSIAAWLRLGQLKSNKTKAMKFDKDKLKDILEELKKLSLLSPEKYLPEVEKRLADVGIVLVYAPYFKNTHIQGATQWIDKDKVFIILKTYKQQEDKFWFNLFHEIGHILKHGTKETFLNIEKEKERINLERDADNFAQKTLIPNFEKEKNNFDKCIDLIDYSSKKNNISPCIVAGRIAHEYNNNKKAWVLLNKYSRNIDYINI